MARIYGLNGALRGKQGNNVFSIQNGTQIVKAYQPVVSNPRSFLQQIQRSKFALAGKISSITPPEALVGLGGANKRSRRAAFVRSLVASTTTTNTPSAGGTIVTAQVDYSRVRFSDGSLSIYSPHSAISAAYTTGTQNVRLRVTVSGYTTDSITSDAPVGYGELIIVAKINPSTSVLDAIQCAIRTNADMTFDFAVYYKTPAHVATYVVPFATLDGLSGFRATGALGDQTSSITLDMLASGSISGMRFGTSELVDLKTISAS